MSALVEIGPDLWLDADQIESVAGAFHDGAEVVLVTTKRGTQHRVRAGIVDEVANAVNAARAGS